MKFCGDAPVGGCSLIMGAAPFPLFPFPQNKIVIVRGNGNFEGCPNERFAGMRGKIESKKSSQSV